MKKYKESIIVFLIYISVIIMVLLASSCKTQYVGSRYSRYPTNNKSFFYNRMGVRPTKQFLKFGNL